MKRILAAIFLFIFAVTSCNVNQDNLNESTTQTIESEVQTETVTEIETETQTQEESIEDLPDEKNIESVLWFNSPDLSKPLDDEKLRDIVSVWFDDDVKKFDFINNYLRERDMYKTTPDNIVYGGDSYIAEYYTDEEKRKTSFIIYFSEEQTELSGSVCCVTFSWDDSKEMGFILYEYDENGDIVYENLYNLLGESLANISYEYFEGIPFPFIKKYRITGDYNQNYNLLNRNQKFWFYKDHAFFDETEKITGYNCSLQNNAGLQENIMNEFVYDNNDRLKEVSAKSSAKIKLKYRENDILNAVDYDFSSVNNATEDSIGKIRYDEQGRMVYRDYYVTHGCHSCIYLYEGESKRPWAYIEFCSQSYAYENMNDNNFAINYEIDSEEEVDYGDYYGYGNEVSVYLFRQR